MTESDDNFTLCIAGDLVTSHSPDYISRKLSVLYYKIDGAVDEIYKTAKLEQELSVTLRQSDFDGFKCWIISGDAYYPDDIIYMSDYDILNAYMSCEYNYILSYNGNGGEGRIQSVEKNASIYVNEDKIVKSEYQYVTLAENTFIKTYIADDSLHYNMIFNSWQIDGRTYNAGSSIKLNRNINAIAKWTYPVLYELNVICEPTGAATLTVVEPGITQQEHKLSPVKTVSVSNIQQYYSFLGWYCGSELKSIDESYQATMDITEPSDTSIITISQTYTAKFKDTACTVIVDIHGESVSNRIIGALTREQLNIDNIVLVDIGAGVTGFEDGLFQNMTQLKAVDYDNTAGFDIPDNCFNGCSELTCVAIG